MKASAYICSKGVEILLRRGVDELVVQLLFPDELPRLRTTVVNTHTHIYIYITSRARGAALLWQQSLRGYLQIKHPYEVGALRVVFDEAHHPGVLQAPRGGTVRQSHVQLGHRRGHRLQRTRKHTTHVFRKRTTQHFFYNSSRHVNKGLCGQSLLPPLPTELYILSSSHAAFMQPLQLAEELLDELV